MWSPWRMNSHFLDNNPQTLIKTMACFSATSPPCFVKRPTLPRANNKSIISFASSSHSPPPPQHHAVWPLTGSAIPSQQHFSKNLFQTHSNQPASLLLRLINPPPFNPLSDFQTHRPTWALWCCGRECVPRCRQHGWSPGSSGYRADGRPYQSFGRECWRHRSGACPWPAAATPTPGT